MALVFVAGSGAGDFCARAAGPSAHASTTVKGSKKSKRRVKREKGQKAPTPDRIMEIQQALARDGSFSGTPNGRWDAATIEATRKFQSAHGLSTSGKLDAPTLQKLGLGSEIAGVAAPLPPLNPSSSILESAHPQR